MNILYFFNFLQHFFKIFLIKSLLQHFAHTTDQKQNVGASATPRLPAN